MKILIVEPMGHTIGHHTYYTRRLSESLLDTGQVERATVVSYAGFKDDWPKREGLRLIQALPESMNVSWAPCERPDLWVEATKAAMRVALPLAAEHDVMQVLDGHFLPLGWMLRRHPARHKTVMLWHYVPVGARLPPITRLPRGLRTRLRLTLPVILPERLLLSNTTLLVHAQQVADAIHGWLPRARVALIPPGSDPHAGDLPSRGEARRALGLDIGDAPALLVFGYLGTHKGVHTLMAALEQDAPDLRLLIAGQPAAGVDIRAQVVDGGWEDRSVMRLAYVPDEQVPLWFRAADAVLLAYPHHFVQNSGVLTRAADFRTPVICSDVGQMGEFVLQYGLGTLFEPEEPRSMRAAIDEMLAATPETIEGFREGLARDAEDHSWPRIAQRHVELYRRVAAGDLRDLEGPKSGGSKA